MNIVHRNASDGNLFQLLVITHILAKPQICRLCVPASVRHWGAKPHPVH